MPSKKMRRTDPRIRQTLNQISQNLESANIATQASLFSFSETYISPCLASFRSCLEASCQPCFTARDDLQRKPHHHHRSGRRARDHFAFEFYDDWNEEAGEWGNDELDRLLARSDHQPGRHGSMSYGSRIIRRKSLGIPKDGTPDPTVVPSSSIFGFLERLPWKFGRRGRRYRPSAADLDENVGRGATRSEGDRLIDDRDGAGEGGGGGGRPPGRNRSATAGSQSTSNSYSSRGDLFPSEDEADAVPIDDEFAMLLARRNTGNTTTTTTDDHSSSLGPTPTSKKPAAAAAAGGSQLSAKPTISSSTNSKTSKNSKNTATAAARNSLRKSASTGSVPALAAPEADEEAEEEMQEEALSLSLSMSELKQEEEHVRNEEEAEIERKRRAAQILARQRGLSLSNPPPLENSAVSFPSSLPSFLPSFPFPLPPPLPYRPVYLPSCIPSITPVCKAKYIHTYPLSSTHIHAILIYARTFRIYGSIHSPLSTNSKSPNPFSPNPTPNLPRPRPRPRPRPAHPQILKHHHRNPHHHHHLQIFLFFLPTIHIQIHQIPPHNISPTRRNQIPSPRALPKTDFFIVVVVMDVWMDVCGVVFSFSFFQYPKKPNF